MSAPWVSWLRIEWNLGGSGEEAGVGVVAPPPLSVIVDAAYSVGVPENLGLDKNRRAAALAVLGRRNLLREKLDAIPNIFFLSRPRGLMDTGIHHQ